MSTPFEGFSASGVASISATKRMTLNPSAEEYVPLSSRESTTIGISDTTGSDDARSRIYINGFPGQFGSGALNESEDEAQLCWPSRLSNDVTRDLAATEYYRRHLCDGKLDSSLAAGSKNRRRQMEMQSSAVCGAFIRNSRQTLAVDGYHGQISPRGGGSKHNGNSNPGFLSDSIPGQSIVDARQKDLEFLALKFRLFPVEGLAKVYLASGCDLNLAIKVITELQESWRSGSSNGNICSSSDKLPSPSSHNVLPNYSDQGFRRCFSPNGPLNDIANDEIELSESLGKLAFLDTSSHQKHARDGSFSITDSSRNIVPSFSTFNDQKSPLSNSSRSSASTYSLSEVEACELACLQRNFDLQSEQAYLSRCKALFAKELSLQQAFMMNTPSSGKAGQTVNLHRNNAALEQPGSSPRQVPRIDLTGLGTAQEVTHVLKQDLGALMRAARLAGHQRMEAVICTGISHLDAKCGWKAPPGLATFVEQFLKDAGLEYMRLRRSMFHVFLC